MPQSRITRLAKTMIAQDFSIVAFCAGPLLEYFTGLSFHLSERPAVLILKADETPAFIFPGFENEKASKVQINIRPFPYDENQDSMIKAFREAMISLGIDDKVGIEPQAFRFYEMDMMQKAIPDLKFVSASTVFEQLLICKDDKEIESIQSAVDIAEEALTRTLALFTEGISEKEFANQLVQNLLKCGSDPLLPFVPIVASGPNSANPHAVPSDRKIINGDLLIVDWGARFNGYVSDITRTFAIGHVDNMWQDLAQIVLKANQFSRESIKNGVEANEIDLAAREYISTCGYGEFFTHRTGHGIGLKEHEAPYISHSERTKIREGMVFTIEPGIYFSGQGGIRIEDDVVATEKGSRTLTTLPREIVQI